MLLPDRIWVCSMCRVQFIEAWRLKRHLMSTHDLGERRAWAVTDRSEYWLRVRRVAYVRETEFGVNNILRVDKRRRLRKTQSDDR
jgi:hypothetical protein